MLYEKEKTGKKISFFFQKTSIKVLQNKKIACIMVESGEMWGKGVKTMFLGEYRHSLDDKGRLFIPAKLRDVLGKRFFISKGFDHCLMIYDEEQWKLFSEKLNALSMGQKKNRDIKRFFFSGADEFTCDKQGRVLLSASLREYAEISKETVIVGVGDKAEIWSAEQWQARDAAAEQMIAEGLDDLNLDI